jgi:hypothetical protein
MNKKWEYLSEEIHGQATNDELNKLGQEGWELFQIVGSTFYFRRERN